MSDEKYVRLSYDGVDDIGPIDFNLYWDGWSATIGVGFNDELVGGEISSVQLTPDEARDFGEALLEAANYFNRTKIVKEL